MGPMGIVEQVIRDEGWWGIVGPIDPWDAHTAVRMLLDMDRADLAFPMAAALWWMDADWNPTFAGIMEGIDYRPGAGEEHPESADPEGDHGEDRACYGLLAQP